MMWLFVILILIAAILMGVIVLIQNPKGGGLTSSIGGFSNQLMGVKRTNDVLEKGTWGIGIFIAILCIASTLFIPSSTSNSRDRLINETPASSPTAPAPAPQSLPGQTAPLPTTPSSQSAPAPEQ